MASRVKTVHISGCGCGDLQPAVLAVTVGTRQQPWLPEVLEKCPRRLLIKLSPEFLLCLDEGLRVCRLPRVSPLLCVFVC